MNEMRPTCRLRFVERPYIEPGSFFVAPQRKMQRILQQWWESPGAAGPAGLALTSGEWRDVQVEIE